MYSPKTAEGSQGARHFRRGAACTSREMYPRLKWQPVVITGMGIVSSIGDNVSAFCAALREGRSGIAHRAGGDPKLAMPIAAEIPNSSFVEKLEAVPGLSAEVARKARRLGQRAPFPIQTSILSATEAWLSAQLFSIPLAPERVGLIVAGQNTTHKHQFDLIPSFREDPEYLSPRYALEFLETNQVGVLSDLFRIRGEGFAVGGASATGNVGIIKAFQAIRAGLLDACLVVGVVADLSPLDIQGFINIGAMGGKQFLHQPEKACRPFDARHEGFIYGQACACLVLESARSASWRGVPVHAAVVGASLNLDGNSSADPNVEGEMKAMTAALDLAGLSPGDVDYLNTHGSSSPLGDRAEAEAVSRVFGNSGSRVWLNATKGLTGHCLWSAGVVELVATVLQMKEGFLHPNRNLDEPIHDGLRFCGTEARELRIDVAMSNSFGFGGINTSVVLKRIPGDR